MIATWTACLLVTVSAVALPQASQGVALHDSQRSASHEINRLQKQYNTWIGDTIKGPHSKCQPKQLARRQEW